MKTYATPQEARAALKHGSVMTIGNFDGVHLGHQALLEHIKELAKRHDAASVVLTFEPHPVRFFYPNAPPFRLTSFAQKQTWVAKQGIDALVVLAFDEPCAKESACDFVPRILHQCLHAKHIVVGKGFRFGKNREGTTDTLKKCGKKLGFDVTVYDPIATDEDAKVISSTRIREHVRHGQVAMVTRLLGRPYSISGEVAHGDARGRTLGYPTANITCAQELMLPDGIYTTTLISSTYGSLPSCTYVGSRPTYGDGPHRVETFVLAEATRQKEELDLYDEQITLHMHERIREDRTFSNEEELIAQMDEDVAKAQAYFQYE